jgi:hypothetical protein
LTRPRLARLDCQLIDGDEQFLQLTEEQRATIAVSTELSERLTLSYLWVLGAYEVLRTLDQRAREARAGTPSRVAERITVTKHLFERVRIPLAKLEASRRNPNDGPIARSSARFMALLGRLPMIPLSRVDSLPILFLPY